MNTITRRAFVVGVLALAGHPTIPAHPVISQEAWVDDMLKIVAEVQSNLRDFGVGAIREISGYPFFESVHPADLLR